MRSRLGPGLPNGRCLGSSPQNAGEQRMSLEDSEPKGRHGEEPANDSNNEEEAADGERHQPTSRSTLEAARHDNNTQQEATVELLRHCRELDGFLESCREAYADLRGAVQELQALTTSPSQRGGQLTEANFAGRALADAAKDEAEFEFTSLAINTSKTDLSAAIGDVFGEAEEKLGSVVNGRATLNSKERSSGHHSPHGSDGDSSSSFDLEVEEEEWSKRIADMEARLREKEQYEDDDDDDDDDDPVLYLPFLHSRPMAQILDRIEEVPNEDVERTSDASCGNSAADTSDEDSSSCESSVERLWASVRQVGPTVPIGKTGKVPYFSPGGPHSIPGPKIPASFRTRGPMGPKEEGPLSKLIDAELLESDDD